MKISVVTVAFNSGATIRQTIESFLQQRYADKELVIVDGGWTDETVSIVRSFQDPSLRVISERDDGIYAAMNKGLRLFTGDAVGFLNSDDTFHADTSLDLIAAALRGPISSLAICTWSRTIKRNVSSERGRAASFRPRLSVLDGRRPTQRSTCGGALQTRWGRSI